GLINPEGIKLRELVQETGLRRHRQRQLRRRKVNRLAQLAIPGPEGELASLESGNVELGGFQVSNQFFGIRRSGARRCFSDRSYRDPDVVIERTGWPVSELLKARLELCPAPLLEGGMPARWHQSLCSGYRPRIPGHVWNVLAKLVAFVGDHQHVVIRYILGEGRNLLLDLLMAAVGTAAADLILVRSLLNDFRPETVGSPTQCRCVSEIIRLGAMDEKPAPPALPNEILGQGIGQHGA